MRTLLAVAFVAVMWMIATPSYAELRHLHPGDRDFKIATAPADAVAAHSMLAMAHYNKVRAMFVAFNPQTPFPVCKVLATQPDLALLPHGYPAIVAEALHANDVLPVNGACD
jgi:hypothetical protein